MKICDGSAVGSLKTIIAQDNPRAAVRVVRAIAQAPDLLKEHPRLGKRTREPGMRRLVISRYPYIVAYRLIDDVIEIAAIFHYRQNQP